MIEKIIIKNFKSIKYLEIPLNKGVTVLTGMNNSGKTNIMEAINVLVNDEYYPSKVNESFYFEDNKEENHFEILAYVKMDNFEDWKNSDLYSSMKLVYNKKSINPIWTWKKRMKLLNY